MEKGETLPWQMRTTSRQAGAIYDGSSSVATTSMKSSQRLARWDSVLGIDAVDAFPADLVIPERMDNMRGATSQLACVATYALGNDGVRRGCIYVIRATALAAGCAPGTSGCSGTLEQVAAFSDDLPGVLDVKCCSQAANAMLSGYCEHDVRRGERGCYFALAACADASLRIFALSVAPAEGADRALDLRFVRGIKLHTGLSWNEGEEQGSVGGTGLALSVDCCEALGSNCVIASVTDSRGGLNIVSVSARDMRVICSVPGAHAAEAWTSCLLPYSSETCGAQALAVSGGDDGVMAGWQMASGFAPVGSDGMKDARAFNVRGAHSGVGVTALFAPESAEESANIPHLLFSGGYDDTLRLWDTRAMRSCICEVNVGGGIWRIKPNPQQPNQLLCACMYDGFKVVDRAQDDSLQIVAAYSGHDSLAYGACWLPSLSCAVEPGAKSFVALTGSFYDHSLQLWIPGID